MMAAVSIPGSMTRIWPLKTEKPYKGMDADVSSAGSLKNLEVHHKECRSQSKDDSEQNLITRCSDCPAHAWLSPLAIWS
jgi:HNH endonuclease